MIKTSNKIIITLLSITTLISYAAEPIKDQYTKIASSNWSWSVIQNKPGYAWLELIDSKGAEMRYDISECYFCKGEDDNCEQDGIYPIKLINNEPVVALVCHVGAHSQTLQVFAPMRDQNNPVFSVTGDYWVNHQQIQNGIKVQYDRVQSDGKGIELTAIWPR